ncbi:MAG: zinc ribbon domain-containing protein [Phycisphaerae bacterium]|nr:zinc ribbon domain-containing protein [Phycisphaerae bacterium]
MLPWEHLTNTIKQLNANTTDALTSEKAKRLRSQLLGWGIALAVIGGLGTFACFAAFAMGGFQQVHSHGQSFGGGPGVPSRILVPFLLIIPFALIGSAGVLGIKLGLSIVIAGEAAKFVDKVNLRCSRCNKVVSVDDKFCTGCGEHVRPACTNCGTINEQKSSFCKSCGSKIR